MLQAGTHAGYVAEMEKSIAEGKVRLLTVQEMEEWHGPRHYITTFAVVKPESVSTKTRVVSNECMWPGPNALCELFDCLVFWRAVEVALMTDLRKAYQAIHTGGRWSCIYDVSCTGRFQLWLAPKLGTAAACTIQHFFVLSSSVCPSHDLKEVPMKRRKKNKLKKYGIKTWVLT